jgi:hypothetical protein
VTDRCDFFEPEAAFFFPAVLEAAFFRLGFAAALGLIASAWICLVAGVPCMTPC